FVIAALRVPVAAVRSRRLPTAALGVALKSNVPGRWQVWQSFRMPGKVTSKKPSVVETACQVYGTSRFADAWMACTNAVESIAQPLPVLFGLWHHEQVVASLR